MGPPKVKVCARLDEWRCHVPKAMQFCWVETVEPQQEPYAGVMTIGDDAEAPHLWLSWRWAEIMPGVIALENFVDISASICLVDPDGRPLTTLAHFREFVTLLHRIHWWQYVDLTSFRPGGASGKMLCRLKPVEELC